MLRLETKEIEIIGFKNVNIDVVNFKHITPESGRETKQFISTTTLHRIKDSPAGTEGRNLVKLLNKNNPVKIKEDDARIIWNLKF